MPLQFKSPFCVPADVQQYAVPAAARTPRRLANDQVTFIDREGTDRPFKNGTRTDLRFCPGLWNEDVQRAVSQPKLVALPSMHNPLVEVGERATVVVCWDQALETLELLVESVSIEHRCLLVWVAQTLTADFRSSGPFVNDIVSVFGGKIKVPGAIRVRRGAAGDRSRARDRRWPRRGHRRTGSRPTRSAQACSW